MPSHYGQKPKGAPAPKSMPKKKAGKGSQAMKDKMKKLREMRKKK